MGSLLDAQGKNIPGTTARKLFAARGLKGYLKEKRVKSYWPEPARTSSILAQQ